MYTWIHKASVLSQFQASVFSDRHSLPRLNRLPTMGQNRTNTAGWVNSCSNAAANLSCFGSFPVHLLCGNLKHTKNHLTPVLTCSNQWVLQAWWSEYISLWRCLSLEQFLVGRHAKQQQQSRREQRDPTVLREQMLQDAPSKSTKYSWDASPNRSWPEQQCSGHPPAKACKCSAGLYIWKNQTIPRPTNAWWILMLGELLEKKA